MLVFSVIALNLVSTPCQGTYISANSPHYPFCILRWNKNNLRFIAPPNNWMKLIDWIEYCLNFYYSLELRTRNVARIANDGLNGIFFCLTAASESNLFEIFTEDRKILKFQPPSFMIISGRPRYISAIAVEKLSIFSHFPNVGATYFLCGNHACHYLKERT